MSDTKTKMTFAVSARRVDAHGSLAKYATVYNTVAPGTQLRGVLKRKMS